MVFVKQIREGKIFQEQKKKNKHLLIFKLKHLNIGME